MPNQPVMHEDVEDAGDAVEHVMPAAVQGDALARKPMWCRSARMALSKSLTTAIRMLMATITNGKHLNQCGVAQLAPVVLQAS